MGKEITHRYPALTIVFKLPGTLKNITIIVEDGCFHFELWLLTILFRQKGFGIKAVDV